MAKETKDLETTEKKRTKKAVSNNKTSSKKSTTKVKKTEPAVKKVTTKKSASSTKKTVATKNTSATAKKSASSSTKKATDKKIIVKKSVSDSKKANSTTKSATKKAEPAKKVVTTKKSTSATAKKVTTKKSNSSTAKKTATKKKSTSTKKTPSKEKKSDTNKKITTKKKTTRKNAKKVESSKELKSNFQSEYYDLPYIYNKTVVKVLAQTPKVLFIYWEISEDDRNIFKNLYGDNFFNYTKPILIVYNDTMNYSFEVEVDDFANSWYLNINDANCEYHVELGRRPIPNIDRQLQTIYIPYYIYVTSSNEMTSPNNTILFDPNIKTVRFRNIKTGEITEKDIMQFTFITNIGIFNIRDLYKYLFPNESFEFDNIVLGNTSSGALSSSGMFSSQFK